MKTPFGDLPDSWAAQASMAEQHDRLRAGLSRRSVLKGAALAGLGAASPAFWVQSAAAAASTPAPCHVAFGDDPRTSAVVSFASGAPFRQAVVEYGLDSGFGSTAPVDVRAVAGVTTRYGHARLADLAPGRAYRYRVRLDGVLGPVQTLRTAPGGAEPFTFTAFGDQGVSAAAAAVIEQIRQVGPRFHLLAGDLCYADSSGGGQPQDHLNLALWDRWLAQIEPAAAGTAWMCATGNHEMEPGYGPQGYDGYLDRFLVPGGGAPGCPSTYSFRYGNVGVVSLDANDVSYEIRHNLGYSGGRQTAWLERRLAAFRAPGSGIDFVVVFFHHCAYGTHGSHGSDGGVRDSWVPLFDRHEVDLVINGHAHVYERTHPLRRGSVVTRVPRGGAVESRLGTTYITAGGGGQVSTDDFIANGGSVTEADGRRHPEQAPWSVPTRTSEHSFLAVQVTPRSSSQGAATMRVRTLSAQGRLLDEVTLRRSGTSRSTSQLLVEGLPWAAGGAAVAVGGGAVWHRTAGRSGEPAPAAGAEAPG